jgi:biopolymer transport protein ExbD
MQDQPSNATATGCVIAAIVVLFLVLCGGGALLLAGVLLFRAAEVAVPAAPGPQPPQVESAVTGHADVLSIDSDGTLYWNDVPVAKADLSQRLQALNQEADVPRSILVRIDPDAPPGTQDEIRQLLVDRQVSFIIEGQ